MVLRGIDVRGEVYFAEGNPEQWLEYLLVTENHDGSEHRC